MTWNKVSTSKQFTTSNISSFFDILCEIFDGSFLPQILGKGEFYFDETFMLILLLYWALLFAFFTSANSANTADRWTESLPVKGAL